MNSISPISCPVITDVSPQAIEDFAIENITFTFDQPLPSTVTFSCIWTSPLNTASTTAGMALGANQITCLSPAAELSLIGTPPNATFYTVDLEIIAGGSTLDSSSLTIFSCPQSIPQSCSACSEIPFCGTCVGPNACISFSQCLLSQAQPNRWLEQDCPEIISIDPDHSSPSGTTITVTGSFFLDTPLQCDFGEQGLVDATSVSDSQIECRAPPANADTVTNLTIIQGQFVYSSNSAQLTYLDCSLFTTCETCVADTNNAGRCGWCLTSASCSVEADCAIDADWQGSACPSITSIDPTFAEPGQEVDFTITGTLFRPGLSVNFNDQLAENVVVVSDSSITGTSPPLDSVGSVLVTLTIGDLLYTSSSIPFNAIPASSSGGGNVALAAGITVALFCLFICCVTCVFFLLYTRFKNILSRRTVTIVEPKWQSLAYGNWLSPVYKGKSLQDYEELIKLFVGPSYMTLLLGLRNATQATEQDSLAQAFTYLHCSNCTELDLILRSIEVEVQEAKKNDAKNTLFRANSMTTKMFKFYAKIVGARYLFEMLARYVAEMELSRKLQNEDLSELNTIADMELDPSKMETDQDELQVQENKTNLLSFSQKILNTILRSHSFIPLAIITIILKVRDCVAEAFDDPDVTFKAVGAFFFLRLICPAIAAPESYFADEPPEPYVRRQLVLVSKMLQNLANKVQFGGKEEFMAPLNPFIIDNAENLEKFYLKLTVKNTSSPDVDVPQDPLFNSCAFLHNHCESIRAHLETTLRQDPEGEEIYKKLSFELSNLDCPPEKLKKKH